MKKKAHGGGGGGGHGGAGLRWLVTYADVITLLLALFIFLYSVSSVNSSKVHSFVKAWAETFGLGGTTNLIEKPAPILIPIRPIKTDPNKKAKLAFDAPGSGGFTESDKHKLLLLLEKELKGSFPSLFDAGKMTIHRSQGGGITLRLLDSALFESGRADVTPKAMVVLKEIAEMLKTLRNEVGVEGHTDDLPVGKGKYRSNWELSAARAGSVVHFLIKEGGIDQKRLFLAGYGEHRPIAPNEPKKGSSKNRRVEIKILETFASARPATDEPVFDSRLEKLKETLEKPAESEPPIDDPKKASGHATVKTTPERGKAEPEKPKAEPEKPKAEPEKPKAEHP